MLITLSGIDCSGKSTQLGLLQHTIEQRGLSVLQFWYRPGYSKELDALRKLVRGLSSEALPVAQQSDERREAFSRLGVSQTWITMALVDMLLQYGAKLRALMCIYNVVICDRYIEDAALDFAFRFPAEHVEESAVYALIRQLCPKPDVSLLLKITREEMLSRMEEKQEPFPDPPNIRKQRYDAYLEMARSGAFSVIDAEQPIESVHQAILAELDLARTG
jgi:thymidylate kinase